MFIIYNIYIFYIVHDIWCFIYYFLFYYILYIMYVVLYIIYYILYIDIFFRFFFNIIDICVEGFVELASTCLLLLLLVLLLLFLPNLFSEYHFCRIGFWICSHLAKIGTNPRSDNAVVICFDVCIPFSIIYSILENIGQFPIMEVLLYNNFLLQ